MRRLVGAHLTGSSGLLGRFQSYYHSCFASGDKKSVCARSHLNVSRKEYDGFVIWWYELVSNNGFKDPMISPKCVCGFFFFYLFVCFIHHQWHLRFCCW